MVFFHGVCYLLLLALCVCLAALFPMTWAAMFWPHIQTALRKFWPAKCKDVEWEVEWEGPIFGVHLGIDTSAKEGTAPKLHLRVGDSIRVSRRKKARFTSARLLVLGAILSLILALGAAFIFEDEN